MLRWQLWDSDLRRFGGSLSPKLLLYWANKAAKAVKKNMRGFAVFQRLWASWKSLRGPNPRLNASCFGGSFGTMICYVLGGSLSRKSLLYWTSKAAKAVKNTMRGVAVFQRLRDAWRGLRGPNPRLSAPCFGGRCGTLICDVLGGPCHVNCFCIGLGKRPKWSKTPCGDLLCFNGSGLPGGA